MVVGECCRFVSLYVVFNNIAFAFSAFIAVDFRNDILRKRRRETLHPEFRNTASGIKSDPNSDDGKNEHTDGPGSKILRQFRPQLKVLRLFAFHHGTNYLLLRPRLQAVTLYFPAIYSLPVCKQLRCACPPPEFALLIVRHHPTKPPQNAVAVRFRA